MQWSGLFLNDADVFITNVANKARSNHGVMVIHFQALLKKMQEAHFAFDRPGKKFVSGNLINPMSTSQAYIKQFETKPNKKKIF